MLYDQIWPSYKPNVVISTSWKEVYKFSLSFLWVLLIFHEFWATAMVRLLPISCYSCHAASSIRVTNVNTIFQIVASTLNNILINFSSAARQAHTDELYERPISCNYMFNFKKRVWFCTQKQKLQSRNAMSNVYCEIL